MERATCSHLFVISAENALCGGAAKSPHFIRHVVESCPSIGTIYHIEVDFPQYNHVIYEIVEQSVDCKLQNVSILYIESTGIAC